jgi:hypothetical protein
MFLIELKTLDLKGHSMSLAEVGQYLGKNESSICSTALNPIYPELIQFFLNSNFLGTTDL